MALALSGCLGEGSSGKDAPAAARTPSVVDAASAGPVAAPAEIRGFVVDDAFVPLPGAAVTVMKPVELRAATDEDGRFGFTGLAEGTYVLRFEKTGFETLDRAVPVLPGQVAKLTLPMRALAVQSNETYHELYEFRGFLSCGLGTRVITYSFCATSTSFFEVDPNDKFLFEFNVSAGAKTVIVDMDWTPVGGVSARELLVVVDTLWVERDNERVEMGREQGPPPFQQRNDKGQKFPVQQSDTNVTWRTRVFAPFSVAPTVIFQQPYELFVTVWFNGHAPENFTALPDR